MIYLKLSLCIALELAAEFIARPQNQEAIEGEKAEFVCSVSKENYEVKWFKGDKELTTDDKYEIVIDGKRRVLIVKNCELKDEGAFTAHIGSVKASADLLVIGKFFFFSIFFCNVFLLKRSKCSILNYRIKLD